MANTDNYGCIDNNNSLVASNLRCQIENKNLLQELGSVYLLTGQGEDFCFTQEYKLGENGKLFSFPNYIFPSNSDSNYPHEIQNLKVRFAKQIANPSSRYFFDNLSSNKIVFNTSSGQSLPYNFNFVVDDDNNSMFTYFFHINIIDEQYYKYEFSFPIYSFLNFSNTMPSVLGYGLKTGRKDAEPTPDVHKLFRFKLDLRKNQIYSLYISETYDSMSGRWSNWTEVPNANYTTVELIITRIK